MNDVDRIRREAGVVPRRGECQVCGLAGNVFKYNDRWFCMDHLSRLQRRGNEVRGEISGVHC